MSQHREGYESAKILYAKRRVKNGNSSLFKIIQETDYWVINFYTATTFTFSSLTHRLRQRPQGFRKEIQHICVHALFGGQTRSCHAKHLQCNGFYDRVSFTIESPILEESYQALSAPYGTENQQYPCHSMPESQIMYSMLRKQLLLLITNVIEQFVFNHAFFFDCHRDNVDLQN